MPSGIASILAASRPLASDGCSAQTSASMTAMASHHASVPRACVRSSCWSTTVAGSRHMAASRRGGGEVVQEDVLERGLLDADIGRAGGGEGVEKRRDRAAVEERDRLAVALEVLDAGEGAGEPGE